MAYGEADPGSWASGKALGRISVESLRERLFMGGAVAPGEDAPMGSKKNTYRKGGGQDGAWGRAGGREGGTGSGRGTGGGENTQLHRLLLCKEKEKIGSGRLPEIRVNHQQRTGTTWVRTNTHTHTHNNWHTFCPISSPKLSFTVQEVPRMMSCHVATFCV